MGNLTYFDEAASDPYGIDPEALLQEIRTFYERSNRVISQLMSEHGGSLARMKLLAYMATYQPVRSADIAAAFGHAPRTVTEAIDGLERAGLINREPDPDDRRAKRIFVTPAGADLLRSLEPVRRAYAAQLFAGVSAIEMEALVATLGKLNAALASNMLPERDRPVD